MSQTHQAWPSVPGAPLIVPPQWHVVSEWLKRMADPFPADPGGEVTPERCAVLRARATANLCGRLPPDLGPALIDVLNALDEARAELDRARREAALLRCVAGETRTPMWLVLMVEQRRADEVQADRALLLNRANLGGLPVVPAEGRRWFTHGEAPRARNAAGYEAARAALAACLGGR